MVLVRWCLLWSMYLMVSAATATADAAVAQLAIISVIAGRLESGDNAAAAPESNKKHEES